MISSIQNRPRDNPAGCYAEQQPVERLEAVLALARKGWLERVLEALRRR